MALVECKECGESVSTKAKTCPRCGAEAPKKTSFFTWLVLLFIVFIVYSAGQSPTPTTNTKSSIELPRPSWTISTHKDEMTNKFSAYAHSPTAYPLRKMSFPYDDVDSYMGVGCDSENEWVYFGFNISPNLTKDEIEDGYNLIKTQIKWNNQVEDVTLTQDWGAKFIHFQDGGAAISKIAASSTALLKLHWHGQQSSHFKYSLSESSRAIAEIKAKCSANLQKSFM